VCAAYHHWGLASRSGWLEGPAVELASHTRADDRHGVMPPSCLSSVVESNKAPHHHTITADERGRPAGFATHTMHGSASTARHRPTAPERGPPDRGCQLGSSWAAAATARRAASFLMHQRGASHRAPLLSAELCGLNEELLVLKTGVRPAGPSGGEKKLAMWLLRKHATDTEEVTSLQFTLGVSTHGLGWWGGGSDEHGHEEERPARQAVGSSPLAQQCRAHQR
jgi:hypothetical protein